MRINSAIKAEAAHIFYLMRPVIDKALKNEQEQPSFSPEMVTALQNLCKAIEAEASPGLKKALNKMLCDSDLSEESMSLETLLKDKD